MKRINDLPPDIIVNCFGQLAPPDLKSSVLVSEKWRVLGEDPSLWTWCVVTIHNREDLQKLSARRLRKVRKIRIDDGANWADGDWEALFQVVIRLPSLKEIDGLQNLNLTSVEQGLLARVLSKLETVDLGGTRLSAEQITTILTCIAQEDKPPKYLNLHKNKLSHVDPETLIRALIKLEKVDLSYTYLTNDQIKSILTSFAKEAIKPKMLNLYGNDLVEIEPEVLSEGVVRLEEVDLRFTCLSNEQVTSILTCIGQADINLKKLNLQENYLRDVEPGILTRAVVRLEEVHLPSTLLSQTQIISILTSIAKEDIKLKKLNLSRHDLDNVEPELLIKAATKLEEVDLGSTSLNNVQITGIFSSIAKEDLALKKLNLKENDLSNVEPALLTRAVTRLEEVDLTRTRLSSEQITGIVASIAQEDIKLNKLNLQENDLTKDQHEVLTEVKPAGLVTLSPVSSFCTWTGFKPDWRFFFTHDPGSRAIMTFDGAPFRGPLTSTQKSKAAWETYWNL